jgi:DNA-binding transcriptional ArsR family regulator
MTATSIFKALSDPTRRAVLQLLRRRSMTAGEIAAQFQLTKATMSAHFAILREADLIEGEKAGKSIIYHLKLSVLEDAMLAFAEAMALGRKDAPAARLNMGAAQ